MGILNVTDDSFYDGNKYNNIDKAYAHALQMIENGADIIDIGGESTRPAAKPIPLDEELKRVLPIIKLLRKNSDICISIDTYKPEVMTAAINAGANLINDIYGLQHVTNMQEIAKLQVPIIISHIQGTPASMQQKPDYPEGVINAINNYFQKRIACCAENLIKPSNIIVDPGFGFGKSLEHNLEILNNIKQFKIHKRPIMLGVSRKSTIGEILNKNVTERLIGSIAATCFSILQGINIIRAHDVAETYQAINMLYAIYSRRSINEQ
jgi:dihydropteroate synthase